MKIVNHLKMLKHMASQGFIKLDPETGQKVRHWTGHTVMAYYVNDGDREFEFNGKPYGAPNGRYGVRYFDGCFKPFVVFLDNKPGPQFV